MPSPARPTLPPAALEWLVGVEPVRIVTLGSPRSMVERLARSGHGVIAVDADAARVARLAAAHQHDEHVFSVVGRCDELPLQPCVAQVVLLAGPLRAQSGGAPIAERQAHAQISRTLAPGGWAAGWQIVRDDSVPWVRRLIALMRSVDPDAMSGTSTNPHEGLLASKYFPRIEQRDFRLWVPITRRQMIEMVTGQRAVAGLDEAARRALIGQASEIFDSAARSAELRLPYQLKCWRAHVDHHELTQPIMFSDGALVIPI